ncbi:FRG domain-containing protein [Mesorhizobium sp. M0960]|uniref:FRG domain-containing protein n=1 Tax=Mesorhizobium sp. M0960 TaxID=2957035 RepID=UPI00333A332B
MFLQHSDDLLFREAATFHVLVLSMGQNELQTALDQRGKVSGNRDFVFRGHQDEDWEIETTYARFTTTPHSAWDSSIDEMLSHFLANTLTIGSVPFSVSNRRSRLEYARHHGVPTPVVDYSYSPYVALYFAFGGLQYRHGSVPKNASIYALDLSRLGIHWRRASARKRGIWCGLRCVHARKAPVL